MSNLKEVPDNYYLTLQGDFCHGAFSAPRFDFAA